MQDKTWEPAFILCSGEVLPGKVPPHMMTPRPDVERSPSFMHCLQIWDDPSDGPFPDEDNQVCFQRQHADGLKSALCGGKIFVKGSVVEYADLLSRAEMEVSDGF